MHASREQKILSICWNDGAKYKDTSFIVKKGETVKEFKGRLSEKLFKEEVPFELRRLERVSTFHCSLEVILTLNKLYIKSAKDGYSNYRNYWHNFDEYYISSKDTLPDNASMFDAEQESLDVFLVEYDQITLNKK